MSIIFAFGIAPSCVGMRLGFQNRSSRGGENSGPQKCEAGASIHLPLDQLQAINLPFGCPLLHGKLSPATTAALSFSRPLAKTRVRRLMKSSDLCPRQKRRVKIRTTRSNPYLPVAPFAHCPPLAARCATGTNACSTLLQRYHLHSHP